MSSVFRFASRAQPWSRNRLLELASEVSGGDLESCSLGVVLSICIHKDRRTVAFYTLFLDVAGNAT